MSQFLRYAAITVSGAAILALEVISSRVMTPYFGVSLYIWASILSVTLIFMAIGYYVGGVFSARRPPVALENAFNLAPGVAAIAISLACAIYPAFFPHLAEMDLLFGSFAGCVLLLAAPLIVLSALNPLLVALGRGGADTTTGDAGAGRILFISTLGSVAGVLITAFGFVAYFTNFQSLLLTGLSLAAVSAILALRTHAEAPGRRLVLTVAVAGLGLCGGLLIGSSNYLRLISGNKINSMSYRVLAETANIYGDIKVLESTTLSGSRWVTYLQDGIIQDEFDANGRPSTLFSHVMERLTLAYVPQARRVLVLGLAAGAIPEMLKKRGMAVEVVEINPDAPAIAKRYFGFNPAGVTVHIQDARTFVKRCAAPYDVAIVDLFHGDGTPDYLLTREFFRDVRQCLQQDGAMVVNAFFDSQKEEANRLILATMLDAFPYLVSYRAPIVEGYRGIQSAYMVANNGFTPPGIDDFIGHEYPSWLQNSVSATIGNTRRYLRADLVGVEPASDEFNRISAVFADSRMIFRRRMAMNLPALALVN